MGRFSVTTDVQRTIRPFPPGSVAIHQLSSGTLGPAVCHLRFLVLFEFGHTSEVRNNGDFVTRNNHYLPVVLLRNGLHQSLIYADHDSIAAFPRQ